MPTAVPWHGMHSRPAPQPKTCYRTALHDNVGPLYAGPTAELLRRYSSDMANSHRKSQCILIRNSFALNTRHPSALTLTLQYHVGSTSAIIVLTLATNPNPESRHFPIHPPAPTCSYDTATHSSSTRAERTTGHGYESASTRRPSERQAVQTFVKILLSSAPSPSAKCTPIKLHCRSLH